MEYRLDELFDLQMGKTPARKNPEYWNSNDYKWISIADLSKCEKYITETKEHISSIAVQESGISEIPANTVIMSFKLSIGKTAITKEPIYSNEAIMSFRDKGVTPLLPDYIYYMFSGRDWSKGSNKAVMGTTLNKATLSQIRIYVHAYEDQKRIVELLDKVSSIISKRKQELVELDDLIKARFVEMFGDNQEVHKLSDIAAITGGLTKNSRRDKLELRKPYLRVANVFFASIDTTEILDIGLTKEEYEKTLLRNGDLLFVEGNGSPDQIGRVAIWNGEIEDCVHQNHLIKARFDLKRMNPVFAMYYFISERGRNQIKKRAVSTSGLYTLSVSKIADFEIPNPPMELQQQFAAFVAAIDKSKATVQKALDETQLLFDSLMQQYFG